MTLKKKYITVAVLSVAVLAFAAAQKISDLTLFDNDWVLTEDAGDLYSESETQILMEGVLAALADDDLFLVYDISTPVPVRVEWQHAEGSIDYTNINGYVAGGHKDWTIDQGSTDIAGVNIGNISTALLTTGSLRKTAGGLQADVSGFSGLVAIDTVGVEVDEKSEIESQISDVADFAEADGDTYSGAHDFRSATLLSIMLPANHLTEDVYCHTTNGCVYGDALFSSAYDFYDNTFFRIYYVTGSLASEFYLPIYPTAYVAAGDVKIVTVPNAVGTGGLHIKSYSTAGWSYVELDSQYDTATFEFDGTSWFIVSVEGGTVN